MKNLGKKEFYIGLSVIMALVVLFVGINYLKGINVFKPANSYWAEYENVSGLEVAAPVMIQGYKVGQVNEIDFPYDKPGKVRVLLALDRHLNVPEDSYAVIEPGFIGGSSVAIHLGKSSSYIPVGGSIPGRSGGGLMSSLSEELMPQVNSILPKIDSLLYSLNVIVSDPALLASVRRLDGISSNLLATTDVLNRDLPEITGSAKLMVNNMGSVVTNVDTITSDLTVLSAQLRELQLRPTLQNVESITANLEKFSSQLNNPNSSLGMLMNDPELYMRLNSIGANVDSLIVDIKRNPKRYISIKLL